MHRRAYVKIFNIIVFLQIKFRINKRKQEFHRQIQSKLRPYKIHVSKCSELSLESYFNKKGIEGASEDEENHLLYAVVTVVDASKGQVAQTWKLNSDPVPVDHQQYSQVTRPVDLDFDVILAGVSGYQFIVLSLYLRSPCSRDLFLGQTHIDLSEKLLWKKGGSFLNDLGAQDFPVKDNLGVDIKTDIRHHPRGKIQFELIPVQGLSSCCGQLIAPSVDDLIRLISVLPKCHGFTVPKLTGNAMVSDRRKYAVTTGGSSSGGSGDLLHSRKTWISIVGGRLYMYTHFGDTYKLRLNLEHFTFLGGVRNKTVVYILRAPEFPDLEFYSNIKEDELRWKCAFLSSFRLRQGHPGGMSVNAQGDLTYDLKSLTRDLSLLEVSRFISLSPNQMAIHKFYSPAYPSGSSKHTKYMSNASSKNSTIPSLPALGCASSKLKKHDVTINSFLEEQSRNPVGNDEDYIVIADGKLKKQKDGVIATPKNKRHSQGGANAVASAARAELAMSVSHSDRNIERKNLFDEIDDVIANIGALRDQYKSEFKEECVTTQDTGSEVVVAKSEGVASVSVVERIADIIEAEDSAFNDLYSDIGTNLLTNIMMAIKGKKLK
jgi:hypothetical protein